MFEVSQTGQAAFGQPSLSHKQVAAYNNSYTATSVGMLGVTGNPADLVVANPDVVKPEQVTAFEVGYRGKFDNLIVDFSAYHNTIRISSLLKL